MLNVGHQPNDKLNSHRQDASSTGTLRSAHATDSLSIQNLLARLLSDLHKLWHSFLDDNQLIRPLADTRSSRGTGLGGCAITRTVQERNTHWGYYWQDVITWKQMMTQKQYSAIHIWSMLVHSRPRIVCYYFEAQFTRVGCGHTFLDSFFCLTI